jgi:hypothetical protein
MPSDYGDAMLQNIIGEARRALAIQDPIGRADIISGQIQPYAGWALRWAIDDCRAGGMTWQAIAGALGRSYPALLRQFEAGGPVYTARAAQSADTRNYDGQTPLRRAATALAQQMRGLGMHRPDVFTYAHLHEAVDKLATAQCVTDDPGPLLQATRDVLALAELLRPHATAQPFKAEAEREIWDTLAELKACYERDRGRIEAGHSIQATAATLAEANATVRASLLRMAEETHARIGSSVFEQPRSPGESG